MRIDPEAAEAGPRLAQLTVFTDGGVFEAEPAIYYPGQAVQGRVTMDSATGRIGTVGIDVFEVER